jgi:hypothetical protein
MNAETIKRLADKTIRSTVRATTYGNEFEKAYRALADKIALYAAIDQLQAERDALSKDAERYRWLRAGAGGGGTLEAFVALEQLDFLRSEAEFDAVIDTAMKDEK